MRYGVPYRGWTLARAGGSRWSRLIANSPRDWPSIRIITTEVSPASAPREITLEKKVSPLAAKAPARGALSLSSV